MTTSRPVYGPPRLTSPPHSRGVLPGVGRMFAAEGLVRRLDWLLVLAAGGLVTLGSLMVWSTTRQSLLASHGDPAAVLKRHLLNVAIGVVLAMCAALLDYRVLRAYSPVVYVASLLGLVAVLSPLGVTIRGSHSWLLLPGGFSLQPSEFAKVALVVGLAVLLAEKRDTETEPADGDVLLALLTAAVPLALVMLQPDLGTALVIGTLVIGSIALSGAPARWVVSLVGATVVTAVVAVRGGLLQAHQVDRLTSFIDPTSDQQGSAYNVHQGLIAIGGGGWTGHGLFHGPQTQGGFVPEQRTDFIFTAVGEELGLVGAAVLLLLMAIVLWRACSIARHADDLFGRLVAVGVVCWLTFQTFENVGMTLGIMPVTGVPLPLVSYGGSSMFCVLIGLGLLQNVHMKHYA